MGVEENVLLLIFHRITLLRLDWVVHDWVHAVICDGKNVCLQKKLFSFFWHIYIYHVYNGGWRLTLEIFIISYNLRMDGPSGDFRRSRKIRIHKKSTCCFVVARCPSHSKILKPPLVDGPIFNFFQHIKCSPHIEGNISSAAGRSWKSTHRYELWYYENSKRQSSVPPL
jgi:hypothetical protein